MKKKKNLKKLLCAGHVDYTNQDFKIGKYDMPYVRCDADDVDVDFIALYSQPSTYHKTDKTAVSFMEYDINFDGLYGLWNGIEYGVKDIIDFFKERFDGIRLFIAPDLSKLGDLEGEWIIAQQFRQRVISVFLTIEFKAKVIPLVSACSEEYISRSIEGMEKCSIVAFNSKGALADFKQKEILKKTVDYCVNNMRLKKIIVYTVSPKVEVINEIFMNAIEKGIEIIIPNNILLERNKVKAVNKNGRK